MSSPCPLTILKSGPCPSPGQPNRPHIGIRVAGKPALRGGHGCGRAGPTTTLACSDMGKKRCLICLFLASYSRQESWFRGTEIGRNGPTPHYCSTYERSIYTLPGHQCKAYPGGRDTVMSQPQGCEHGRADPYGMGKGEMHHTNTLISCQLQQAEELDFG